MKSGIRGHHEGLSPRRKFCQRLGAGFGTLALLEALFQEGQLGQASPHRARARSCIFLFMYGGPSQLDTFDYKPDLKKREGEEIDLLDRRGATQRGRLLGSRRPFSQHGHSGAWISSAFPHLAKHADDLCFLKSLQSNSSIHASAVLQATTGQITQGWPSLGSWISYGLGTLNRNLPTFVVFLDPRGGPSGGVASWSQGFLPARYQGTPGEPMATLKPMPERLGPVDLAALQALNQEHRLHRPGEAELEARIASYELAFRMQMAAPEALDLTREDRSTLRLYGLDVPRPEGSPLALGPAPFGRQCLMARRLVERGVRFVQITSGGGVQQSCWDGHFGMEENLSLHAPEVDQPIAALLTDLKRRGLLDTTLVVWGGEFGRQPIAQGKDGRDHNPRGFTYWLAGGGIKGGLTWGATDDLGQAAVVEPRPLRDLHATILHLMGLDPARLTYPHGGLDQRLVGMGEPRPIEEVMTSP